MAQDSQYGYGIEAGGTRTFEIAFGSRSSRSGNGLSEVSWFENIWLKSASEETSVKAAAARNTGL